MGFCYVNIIMQNKSILKLEMEAHLRNHKVYTVVTVSQPLSYHAAFPLHKNHVMK